MTTTTQKHTTQYEASEDGYNWNVLDADGDVVDSFKSRVEAHKDARERDNQDQAEALQSEILDALYDLDLATLRKIKALLPGG